MPKFIDTHGMEPLTVNTLKDLQKAPKDKFGVTHHDILYNEKLDKTYCILNAPNEEAVRAHHKAAGIECDWVEQVESARE